MINRLKEELRFLLVLPALLLLSIYDLGLRYAARRYARKYPDRGV